MTDLETFRTLARNWEALGETDPLFGVLSDPAKHGGKWDPGEFFASGRAHVDKLLRTLADARASFEPGTCLDFGCGVGRLTVPLSRSFQHTVGVDVARPMIASARGHVPHGARCEFVLNRRPDLRRFASSSFDVVHSCLVLQHIPPAIALRYVAEFFRVCRPGGLVVFQLPAVKWTEAELQQAHALPGSGYAASIAMADPPASLASSARAAIALRVTNRSDIAWRHDIPAGRHICVGNHWLLADGTPVVSDDGRARLPRPVDPGATVEVTLTVQAPSLPGEYILEIDLVQEHVCWFAQKGSSTARAAVTVTGARSDVMPAHEPEDPAPPRARSAAHPRAPLVTRILRSLRGGTPTFEMHAVPRAVVEETIRSSGGVLIRAVDDNAAGPGWLSYTYVCRKSGG